MTDPTHLMFQATYTADVYFHAAVKTISKEFGDGYPKKHPELVAAYMTACMADYETAIKDRRAELEGGAS